MDTSDDDDVVMETFPTWVVVLGVLLLLGFGVVVVVGAVVLILDVVR